MSRRCAINHTALKGGGGETSIGVVGEGGGALTGSEFESWESSSPNWAKVGRWLGFAFQQRRITEYLCGNRDETESSTRRGPTNNIWDVDRGLRCCKERASKELRGGGGCKRNSQLVGAVARLVQPVAILQLIKQGAHVQPGVRSAAWGRTENGHAQ